MSDERYQVALDAREFRVVTTLRDMPEGPLKARVQDLMDHLVTFARNPKCCEYQPDGVPCASAHNDCDTCQVVLQMLETLTARIPSPR